MKTYIKHLVVAVLAIALASCDNDTDFLDTDFNGVVAVKTVNDYELILNDRILGAEIFAKTPFMQLTDNVITVSSNNLSTTNRNAYLWNKDLYMPGEDPQAWSGPYKRIFSYNTIINEIDDAADITDSSELAKQIKAEALFGRAFEYWILQNLFAPPYDGTNGSELSVPFVESSDITVPLPERMTIDELNARIVTDIEIAIPNLPDVNKVGNFRASKLAAYGFLSRYYLFIKDYDKVVEYADLALALNSDIYDITPDEYVYPRLEKDNIEKIYLRPTNVTGDLFFGITLSESLVNSYFSNLGDFAPFVAADKRVDKWLFLSGATTLTFGRPFLLWLDRGLSIPEIILNKAEALERSGATGEGLALVNELRTKRIVDSFGLGTDLISFTNDPEEILGFVLDERRRELLPYALRWFDMRRLQLEGRIGTITHDYIDGTSSTLEEGSERYTLTIPVDL